MVIRVTESRDNNADQQASGRAPRISAGKLLQQQRIAVVPGRAYRVHANIVDQEDCIHAQATLLGLRFLTHDGQVVDSPIEQWTFSKRYMQWAAYLPSNMPNSPASKSRPFTVPEGASQVDITLFQWQGSASVSVDGDLALHKEKETWESIQARERKSVRLACEVCRDVLQDNDEDADLLHHIFEFAQRHGNASLLRQTAAALLALDLKYVDRQPILLALDELRELDPNWLPFQGSLPAVKRTRAPAPRRPYQVAHLCGNTSDAQCGEVQQLAAITQHHSPVDVRPLLVTPAEYLHGDAVHAPWEQSDCLGMPWFQLDTLGTPAIKGIERTRVMELDVILATHVCRANKVAAIHAHAGRRGYDLALRGLAIAAHLQIPLIYEIGEPCSLLSDEPSWSLDSEIMALRCAQQHRCMRMAAAIITASEQIKRHLVERGLAEENIFVVAPAIYFPGIEIATSMAKAPDSYSRRAGIIAKSVPDPILPQFLESVAASRKMHLAVYGNNQELELWRTIAAQHPRLDVAYVQGEDSEDAEVGFLAGLQCLVLPGSSDDWTRQRLSKWGLKAAVLSVPVVDMSNGEAFDGAIWQGKQIVLTADWSTLPKILRGILAGTVAVKNVAKRAHDWARTRSPSQTAASYEAVYDHAMKQDHARTAASNKRPSRRSRDRDLAAATQISAA